MINMVVVMPNTLVKAPMTFGTWQAECQLITSLATMKPAWLVLTTVTLKSVASLRGWTAPGDTFQGGDTRRNKILWANLQRTVEKRGRTGKRCGVTPWRGGDTRVKAIKSDSDSDSNEQKKVARFWEEERRNQGTPQNWWLKKRVTPSVAAPGVTHPSDATG